MPCPHFRSPKTMRQHKITALSYQTFRCAACWRRFHECTGTPFNFPWSEPSILPSPSQA